ncbi:hypothetical protein [Streptomyces sp. NPDC005907]|uniref:hypothetical protein n=1 Tax=Streptomyces sp. NPDC005907 TaxID=3154571 RepID=UPI0033E42195
MGERQSDGRAPGRRAVPPVAARPVAARPGAGGPGPAGAESVAPAGSAEASVEVLLAAVRSRPVDPQGERRAVAAFRAAREQGARDGQDRSRDDWRPREQRRARRSLRTVLVTLCAGLALGGVAVAAIGPAGVSPGDGAEQRRSAEPSHSTAGPSRGRPGATPAPGGTSPAGRSPDAGVGPDTEAHCRAYEAVAGRGRALGSAAWQRLVAEAGGEDHVEAYCAERLGGAEASVDGDPPGGGGAAREKGRPTRTGRPTRAAEPVGPGSAARPTAPKSNGNGNGNGNGGRG